GCPEKARSNTGPRWAAHPTTVDLQADGTVTATSPGGDQTLRGHPNRGPKATPRDGRPPPARAA
ncbi:MAG: hypothetical protein FWE35_26940, partial [Streptosporangiales bacterium]|nr:hypothetical protein [Streptosporangiales bacterium]